MEKVLMYPHSDSLAGLLEASSNVKKKWSHQRKNWGSFRNGSAPMGNSPQLLLPVAVNLCEYICLLKDRKSIRTRTSGTECDIRCHGGSWTDSLMMNVSNSLAQYSLSFAVSGHPGPKVGARAFSEALQYWASLCIWFSSEWNILAAFPPFLPIPLRPECKCWPLWLHLSLFSPECCNYFELPHDLVLTLNSITALSSLCHHLECAHGSSHWTKRVNTACEVKGVLLIFPVSLVYGFTSATDELQCLVVWNRTQKW